MRLKILMLLPIALSILLLLYIFIPTQKKYRYFSALFITFFFIPIFLPSLHQNYHLAQHGMQETGVLTGKNCDTESSQRIEYDFSVSTTKFSGAGRPGKGNQSCDNLNVGDPVFVTYLPTNETINVPERGVEGNVLGYSIGLFALYVLLLWIGNAQEKFRKNKLNK